MNWRIELSRPAVNALKGLSRSDQRAVAEAIRRLERGGLPPGREGAGPVEVPAGEHVLVCVADADRIVVVTLRPAGRVTSGSAVGHMVRRWTRNVTGGGMMTGFARDVRFAARSLRRSPGFTIAAVLTLALGIGATAAVFSVANGVLLEPLPYRDANRVVAIWGQWTGYDKTWVSDQEYLYYLQQNRTLDDVALYFSSSHNFTSTDDPERVGSSVVTANTFEVLGVAPRLGRVFTRDEALAEAPVVMLGHPVWQRRFRGDPGVVGRDVEINGTGFTVVGVLPEGFILPVDYGSSSPSEIYFALPLDPDMPAQLPTNGGSHGYYGLARLADGAEVADARRDLEGLIERARSEGVYQESFDYRPIVNSVTDDIVGSARTLILILLGACALVLLIACGNVANLILSRSEGRLQDVAVRRALGAGHARIARQLFAESALIAGSAAVIGLLLAGWGVDALLSISPESLPRSESVSLDGRVVSAVLALAVFTAVLFGWVPAARVARAGVGGTLGRSARGAGAGARSKRMQGFLVAGQAAMAVVLLAGSGLMMRTFAGLMQVDLGFHAENVLTFRLTTPSATYPEVGDVQGFYDELLRRIRDVPGVSGAGAARLLPLASEMGDSGFRVVGRTPGPGESTSAEWQWATPGYLEVMGIPVVRGRSFEPGDDAEGQVVMLVNETAARQFWGDADPIGTRVSTFAADTAVVVGIVGDLRHHGARREIRPRFYRPQAQILGPGTIRRMTVTVQAQQDPTALIPTMRDLVRALDPSMPVSEVRTMDQVIDASLAPSRFAMVLLGVFAGLALLLAVVGLYGVLAYVVSRRTREIGIRMALGAEGAEVVGMVVRQGMTMAVVGIVVGTVAALALTRFMESMLFGVEAQDPLTFVSVPLMFAVVALVASWVPAARAARVEPTTALRYD